MLVGVTLLGQVVVDDVHGQGEDNGGVLFSADRVQSLKNIRQ